MPKTLLLADDSVTIQKVVGITFANEDIELVTVDNGDAALAKAREVVPDVVLADVSMPGLNGYELCAAIKRDPALAHVPVLLLTGTFEGYDEDRTRQAGADGHIAKPFEAQALVDLVHSTLDRAPAATQEPPAPAPPPASAETVVMAPGAAPATRPEPRPRPTSDPLSARPGGGPPAELEFRRDADFQREPQPLHDPRPRPEPGPRHEPDPILQPEAGLRREPPLRREPEPHREPAGSGREPMFDRPGAEPTFDRPGAEPTFDRSRPEPTSDRPGPEPMFDRPGAEPTFDRPGPQPTSDRPGPEPVFDRPGAEPTFDRPGPEPALQRPGPERGAPSPTPHGDGPAAGSGDFAFADLDFRASGGGDVTRIMEPQAEARSRPGPAPLGDRGSESTAAEGDSFERAQPPIDEVLYEESSFPDPSAPASRPEIRADTSDLPDASFERLEAPSLPPAEPEGDSQIFGAPLSSEVPEREPAPDEPGPVWRREPGAGPGMPDAETAPSFVSETDEGPRLLSAADAPEAAGALPADDGFLHPIEEASVVPEVEGGDEPVQEAELIIERTEPSQAPAADLPAPRPVVEPPVADPIRPPAAPPIEADFGGDLLSPALAAQEPEPELTLETEAPADPVPAAPKPAPSAPVVDSEALSGALEKIAWEAFGPVSEQIVREVIRKVEEIAWEVIPQLAERLIQEEIERLRSEME